MRPHGAQSASLPAWGPACYLWPLPWSSIAMPRLTVPPPPPPPLPIKQRRPRKTRCAQRCLSFARLMGKGQGRHPPLYCVGVESFFESDSVSVGRPTTMALRPVTTLVRMSTTSCFFFTRFLHPHSSRDAPRDRCPWATRLRLAPRPFCLERASRARWLQAEESLPWLPLSAAHRAPTTSPRRSNNRRQAPPLRRHPHPPTMPSCGRLLRKNHNFLFVLLAQPRWTPTTLLPSQMRTTTSINQRAESNDPLLLAQ